MAHDIKPARPLVAVRPPSPASIPALINLVYAAAVYLFFVVVLGYAAGFFIGFGVPKGIDQGTRSAWPLAVAVDAGLLLLFAVQHTVMARPWFKRRWARIVPAPAERTTFVLCANLLLALLFWLWRPVRGTVWNLSGPGAYALLAVYLAGWAVAVRSTFLISHFDLFGLRQAYLHARGASYRPPPFTERGLYRRIRHPLMAGFVVVFWSAPTMTVGHLLFAAAATGYILAGIAFEEHDLKLSLGQPYTAYRARVPALIPHPRGRPQRSAENERPQRSAESERAQRSAENEWEKTT
jgi:methanethiol S-methyltransferase